MFDRLSHGYGQTFWPIARILDMNELCKIELTFTQNGGIILDLYGIRVDTLNLGITVWLLYKEILLSY